jgi:hypothetical protein
MAGLLSSVLSRKRFLPIIHLGINLDDDLSIDLNIDLKDKLDKKSL